jgi:hypothetical protein
MKEGESVMRNLWQKELRFDSIVGELLLRRLRI